MCAVQSPPPVILPVVYVAGPYRAATVRQVQANIWRAQEAALAVWREGAVAICPHGNTMLFDGECDDDVWLRGDLELLRRSDAVLMVGAWQLSRGATAERRLADTLGLPVFCDADLGALRQWVADWKRATAPAE